LKYPTAVKYRIWTYTDFVRQAVLLSLFQQFVLVSSMNGFDRRAQLQSQEPTFPPFMVGGFLRAVAKRAPRQANQEIEFLYGMRQNE